MPLLEEATTVKLTIEVDKDRADAFMDLWMDFCAGPTVYDEAVREKKSNLSRGIESLKTLYAIAQGDTGQCGRVAKFLAGLYNGTRFPFDLTELRGLDSDLFEHCMLVLRMDARNCQQEVHTYFENGGKKWEEMIRRWGMVDAYELRAPR